MDFILIVEDDAALAEGLCRALSSAEIQAESCGTLTEAKIRLAEWKQDTMPLLLLDVNLPDGNGFEFLQFAKNNYDISVIMLTANDLEMDIVAGLEQGADDYITKPFSLAVLRARVAAQLRRQRHMESGRKVADASHIKKSSIVEIYAPKNYFASEASMPKDQITSEVSMSRDGTATEIFTPKADSAVGIAERNDTNVISGKYQFDFYRMQFLVDGQAVELSKTEQKLLRYLVENAGITLSRDRLIDRIWSDGAEFVDENALSVAVKRLRDKLSAQDHIKTVYGVGYVWKKE